MGFVDDKKKAETAAALQRLISLLVRRVGYQLTSADVMILRCSGFVDYRAVGRSHLLLT